MPKLIMDLPERFWAKTCIEDRGYETPCLVWTAYTLYNGYGRFGVSSKIHYAHRVAYGAAFGEIPAGLVLDHLCRVRACVNATHLEPVTNRENILRGETIMAANVAKTHCPQGHEYNSENTLVNPPNGRRRCASCVRDHGERHNAQRRQARIQNPTPKATHCHKGHPYEGDNLRINKAGARVCQECARETDRRHKAKRKNTPGRRFADALRQLKRIGHRTPLTRGGLDMRADMIESVGFAATTSGYYSPEIEDALRPGFAAVNGWVKHVDGYRLNGTQISYLRSLTPWQFATLLGEMVDAQISNVGEAERWFRARQDADIAAWNAKTAA
jgi:hypothetical protein